MKRLYLLLTIALLSALGLGAAPPAQAAPARADIPAKAGRPLAIQTDGVFVAWSQEVQPNRFSRYANLYAAAIGDAQPTLIATLLNYYEYIGGQQPSFALDGGTLVWLDAALAGARPYPLRARNLRTGENKTVTEAQASFPAIRGSTVVWWENLGQSGEPGSQPALLRARDIGAMSEPVTLAQIAPTRDYLMGGVQISESWVTWRQGSFANGESNAPCWEQYALPRSGGAPQRIDSLGCDLVFALNDGELSGDTLTYTNSYRSLVMRNLASGQIIHMSGPHVNRGNVADGRYVFWGKLDSPTVWGYDTATDSAFPIDQQGFSGPAPAARNGVAAWFADAGAGQSIVRARPIANLLPSAAAPAVAGRDYFPETGHTLGGAFRDYWRGNGGLSVFGYALTEEFTQRAPESADAYTVQYFERQRFEYHPENAGTPYAVLLGRLGAEALAAQGRDWQALPKASPSAPHYYPITGQAIAPEFWGYWRGHGLEFGDRSVSEREALALWGYPITPPALEQLPTGETLLVQWFERARFEYHPANADPYKVLLGRLAADRVDAFDWR